MRQNPSFYRTSAGAEIDLVLEMPSGDCYPITPSIEAVSLKEMLKILERS